MNTATKHNKDNKDRLLRVTAKHDYYYNCYCVHEKLLRILHN